jgi:superfamily II DNA/RNA helicase
VHGDLGQGAREQALRAFRSGKIDVLVATDVAARGIDVQDVTHVINYQCPDDASTFLHRIGRTGRAGASGVAVTFVDWDDVPKWGLIDKDLDLGIPVPQETYSSSPHLFTDLGIPVGTKGTLPRSARVRAGLEAEEVEDLGETGRRRPAAASPRPGGRSTGRERGGQRGGTDTGAGTDAGGDVADDAPALPKRTGATRRRTRGGGAAAAAGAATAGDSGAGPDGGESASSAEDAGAPRRRRRGGRGRGRGAGADSGEAGSTATPTAAQGTAPE